MFRLTFRVFVVVQFCPVLVTLIQKESVVVCGFPKIARPDLVFLALAGLILSVVFFSRYTKPSSYSLTMLFFRGVRLCGGIRFDGGCWQRKSEIVFRADWVALSIKFRRPYLVPRVIRRHNFFFLNSVKLDIGWRQLKNLVNYCFLPLIAFVVCSFFF